MPVGLIVHFFAFLLFSLAEGLRPRGATATWAHNIRNITLGVGNAICLGIVGRFWFFLLIEQMAPYSLMSFFAPSDNFVLLYSFILLDLFMYLWHRVTHLVDKIYLFHQVHHSDLRLNSSSGIRFHPGEIFISYLLRAPIAALLGVSTDGVLLYDVCAPFFIYFHHSNLIMPAGMDKLLSHLIITPRLHQLHHSRKRLETDSNFGVIFSLWDRLFNSRTYNFAGEVKFGLAAQKRAYGLKELLFMPFDRKN